MKPLILLWACRLFVPQLIMAQLSPSQALVLRKARSLQVAVDLALDLARH